MRSIHLQVVSLIVSGAFFIACGGGSEKKPAAKSQTPVEKTSSDDSSTAMDVPCNGLDKTKAPAFQSNTGLDPNSTKVFADLNATNAESICQIMNKLDKEVLVLQFAGVVCESCRGEATQVTKAINDSGKAEKIQHIVIFVDKASSGIDPAWPGQFISSYTNNQAIAKFEPQKVMFSRFSKSPDDLTFGNGVAINKYGQAFYVNDAAQLNTLVQKAAAMVK